MLVWVAAGALAPLAMYAAITPRPSTTMSANNATIHFEVPAPRRAVLFSNVFLLLFLFLLREGDLWGSPSQEPHPRGIGLRRCTSREAVRARMTASRPRTEAAERGCSP